MGKSAQWRCGLAAVLCISSAADPSTAAPRADGMRFVPDVEGQFRALTEHPDALGFHIGGSPNPSTCKHYQAITRIDDPSDGTPYFLLTRSGNTPPIPGPDDELCNDSPGETGKGNLISVRMDSRNKTGERMRSNRLESLRTISATRPPNNDIAASHVNFNGEGDFPDYGHPGGMQAIGQMLALTVEHRYDSALPRSGVLFIDVSRPESPSIRSFFSTENETGDDAGVVGVTPLPGGRYLMVMTGGQNETLYFYRSTLTDLSSGDLDWEPVGTIPGPSVTDAHQTLNFIREGDINGRLYLAGARGKYAHSNDRIDLYEVRCDTPDCAPGETIVLDVIVNGKQINPSPSLAGNDRLVNLAAASGFYVSPSGELILYATEHDNDGPSGTVKAGEWRHEDVVRPGSPTFLPTAIVAPSFDVDEGGDLVLTGQARRPATEPWIQLYTSSGHSLIVDFNDEGLDDFNAFWVMDPTPPSFRGFANNAQAWRWFADPACTIEVSNVVDFDLSFFMPPRVRSLQGTGTVERDDDLTDDYDDAGIDDLHEKIDRVHFATNCDDYYGGGFSLYWDLDGSGTFGGPFEEISFDASELDGPSTVDVAVQARRTTGGSPGSANVVVNVHNVAPVVAPLLLEDPAGNDIGSQVPFVLTGLPTHVIATFTDRGIPDRQTAQLDWGDGTTDPSASFSTFVDAFGGEFGQARHSHRYPTPGTYSIALRVLDDDGGAGAATAALRVVDPADAVRELIGLLDVLIAATPDQKTRKLLDQARAALAGHSPGQDGALNKILSGQTAAAQAALRRALDRLTDAQTRGADVAVPIAIIQQVLLALSQP